MTEQSQQEYIITEEQLSKIEKMIPIWNLHGIHLLPSEIRSSPAPTAYAPPNLSEDYWFCPFRKGCEDGENWCSWPCDKWAAWHDAAIREQAKREGYNEALDAIRAFTHGNSETIEADDGTLEDAVFLGELLAKIDSLRSSSTTAKEERK